MIIRISSDAEDDLVEGYYSTIDDHFIVIEYQGQIITQTKNTKASWSGRSGSYWIAGENGLFAIRQS